MRINIASFACVRGPLIANVVLFLSSVLYWVAAVREVCAGVVYACKTVASSCHAAVISSPDITESPQRQPSCYDRSAFQNQ